MATENNNNTNNNKERNLVLPKSYINYIADFYRNQYGVNVIWVNTQNRDLPSSYPQYTKWKTEAIPQEIHDQWKENGMFTKGIARITGHIWHRNDLDHGMDIYWFYIDVDNQLGIEVILKVFSSVMNKEYKTTLELAEDFLIDTRPDAENKMHVCGYTKQPFIAKSSNKNNPMLTEKIKSGAIPEIEIKKPGELDFCSPCYTSSGSQRRCVIEDIMPKILTIEQASKFQNELDRQLALYGIDYLKAASFRQRTKRRTRGSRSADADADDVNESSMPTIEDMLKPEFKVYAGNNRHVCLLRIFESKLFKEKRKGILTEEQIKEFGVTWNQEHCVPPLLSQQVESLWTQSLAFYEAEKDNYQDDEEEEFNYEELKN